MNISLVENSLVTQSIRNMWGGLGHILDVKDIPGEFWKPIKDYEGIYEVSTFFRVRSLSRVVKEGKGKRLCDKPIHSKILKQNINEDGYWQVRLSKNGVRQSKRLHRLYADAFMPNPENKQDVNHKNLIKSDNIPCNLEWNTPSENTQHAKVNGAFPCGEQVKHSKLTKEQVMEIYNSKDTSTNIQKKYGINKRMIYKIRSGKSWVSVTGGIQVFNKRTYSEDVVRGVYLDKRSPTEISKTTNIPLSVVCRIKNKQTYKNILNGLN